MANHSQPPRNTQRISSGFLSEELVLEILYHAAPKTILKCAGICRSWYALIHSRSFISAHCNRRIQNHNNSDSLFLFREDRGLIPDEPWTYSFASDFGTRNFTQLSPLHFPLTEGPENYRFLGVGSCSGLVCIADFVHFNLTLWNPSIRKWRIVPFPVHQFDHLEIYGLGFDSSSEDFKILRILSHNVDIWIYSLNQNSWKNITHLALPDFNHYYYDAGCVLSGNGFLNCVAGVDRMFDDDGVSIGQFVNCAVVGFDLNRNVFHETPFPDCLRQLAVWEVKLSMMGYGESSVMLVCGFVHRGVYDVWGLGEYCDANSWKKLYKIRDTVHGIRGWVFRMTGELLLERTTELNIVNGENEDADVVLDGPELGIIVCYPETKQFNYLVNWGFDGYSYVGPFVETLVLPDAQVEDDDQTLIQASLHLSQATFNGADRAERNDDEVND